MLAYIYIYARPRKTFCHPYTVLVVPNPGQNLATTEAEPREARNTKVALPPVNRGCF